MKVMWFQACIDHPEDAERIWEEVPHGHASFFERNGEKRITFAGPKSAGVRVLDRIMEVGNCRVHINCGF